MPRIFSFRLQCGSEGTRTLAKEAERPPYRRSSWRSWPTIWSAQPNSPRDLPQSVADAAHQLGGASVIRDTFIGFQQYLYEERVGEVTAT